MITLGQFLAPVSQDAALETILEFMQGLGFQATSWQDGSVQRTFFTGVAWLYSGLTSVIADKAASPYPHLARGAYQDELGTRAYDLPRVAATRTEGTMTFTLSAAAAPAAWADDELVIADAETAPANTYRAEAGSLLPGETLEIPVHAETAGAAANIPNAVPLFLWTPITGLTVTNPAPAGQSTWITAEGADQEANERYADRMIGRWSRLSYGNIEGAYKAWALEALPALTRVTVTQGPAEGEVIVTGATATGGLTAPQITTIDQYLRGQLDAVGRRPINDVLTVRSAVTKTTPALNLTVTCASQLAGTAAARTTAALVALFGSLPIGGEKISPDPVGYVRQARMYQVIMALDGIVNVTGIPADIVLAGDEIYSPAINVAVVST